MKNKETRKLGTGTCCSNCGVVVFRATFHDGKWLGPCCIHLRTYTKSTFPFVTPHITGQPVEVKSLRHLRQLEQQHGVAVAAYAMDQKNFNDPPQQDPRVQDVRANWKPIFGERLEG